MHKIPLIVPLSGTSNLLTGDHIYGCQKNGWQGLQNLQGTSVYIMIALLCEYHKHSNLKIIIELSLILSYVFNQSKKKMLSYHVSFNFNDS